MSIPVSYSSNRKFNASPEVISSGIEQVLTEFGWKHERVSPMAFKGHIGWSIWSWSENFTIEIDPDSTVRMKSVCSFPLTIVSWGKNKRNVNEFFTHLGMLLLPTP